MLFLLVLLDLSKNTSCDKKGVPFHTFHFHLLSVSNIILNNFYKLCNHTFHRLVIYLVRIFYFLFLYFIYKKNKFHVFKVWLVKHNQTYQLIYKFTQLNLLEFKLTSNI